MGAVGHQTIRLSTGRHASPRDGACVMELASMLAGDGFSDRPLSVCPVIASFMRAYNDSIDDERRQDLYLYASAVVGTRSTQAVEEARLSRLSDWIVQARAHGRLRSLLPARLRTARLRPPAAGIPVRAARSISRHTDRTHRAVLALIDELVALGKDSDAATLPATHSDAQGPSTSPALR
jgi:hypothetical protein